MKIVINGNTYTNPKWEVSGGRGTLRIATEAGFAELSELFDVTAGAQIVQTDDEDATMGIWYVQALESIEVLEEAGSRIARVSYNINSLPEDMKTEIDTSIEESNDAIFELAGMIDEAKTMIQNNEQQFEERDTRLGNHDEQLSHFQNLLDEFVQRLNALTDRVAALENKIGG